MGGPDDSGWTIRDAIEADVHRICSFGETYIRPHYAPLIGASEADRQVTAWWNDTQIRSAVARGLIVIAETSGVLVGVAQRGWNGADHVIYKLYLDPAYRGQGIGPDLVEAVIRRLPAGAGRLCVEHFAGNERAGAFYERERFTVERIEPSDAGPALDVVWRARQLR